MSNIRIANKVKDKHQKNQKQYDCPFLNIIFLFRVIEKENRLKMKRTQTKGSHFHKENNIFCLRKLIFKNG